MDSETQMMVARVFPTRRVNAERILTDIPADNSQETGDSISFKGDMGVDNNIRENNIHNPSIRSQVKTRTDADRLNTILAKKLHTEGLSNVKEEFISSELKDLKHEKIATLKTTKIILGNGTQVIITKEEKPGKRKRSEVIEDMPVEKKTKASQIMFDVDKKVEKSERAPTTFEGVHSVTVNTVTNTHKYDTLVPLDAERQLVWCRLFPACRYGSACAFAHPRCRFLAACARPTCVFSHSPNAPSTPTATATHPVRSTAPRFVSRVAVNMFRSAGTRRVCKFYPNCLNPGCYFKHPKPCRYGKNCTNKVSCIFYHADVSSA